MPNTKSAQRRMRGSVRKRLHNQSIKSRLRSLEKTYDGVLSQGKKEDAAAALRALSSALDKAAKTGVVNRVMASRKKSRLALRLNAARPPAAPTAPAAPA